MYMIRFINTDQKLATIVVEFNNLSLILELLESSNKVKEFKVYMEGCLVTQIQFGWGGYEKWVTVFSHEINKS